MAATVVALSHPCRLSALDRYFGMVVYIVHCRCRNIIQFIFDAQLIPRLGRANWTGGRWWLGMSEEEHLDEFFGDDDREGQTGDAGRHAVRDNDFAMFEEERTGETTGQDSVSPRSRSVSPQPSPGGRRKRTLSDVRTHQMELKRLEAPAKAGYTVRYTHSTLYPSTNPTVPIASLVETSGLYGDSS